MASTVTNESTEAARPDPPRKRRPSVPLPLAVLLLVVAIFGCAWALINPPFQSPDEDVHFAYVQTLAELHHLPGGSGPPVSSEELRALTTVNADAVAFFNYSKPEWSRASYNAWLHGTQGRRNDGGGRNTASSYPPAYYMYETIPYELASGGTIFARLYLMRIFSVGLLLLTTAMTWLLAGEMFGRRRPLQLLAAATVGLWPMLDFISSSINPDALLYATWTATLWMGVKVLRRGITLRRAVALGLLLGLALLTKASSLALIPAVIFCIGFALVRSRGLPSGRSLLAFGAAALTVVVAVGAWYAVNHAHHRSAYGQASILTSGGANIRAFLSYLWEFYLPRLPGEMPHYLLYPVISHYPAFNIWLGTGWASFGWVTVWFAAPVYYVFLAITVVLTAAAAATGVRALRNRRLRAVRGHAGVICFILLAAVPMLLALHWVEFKMGMPFNQGRYLFPLAALGGLIVAQATRIVGRRRRTAVIATLLGGLIVFQIASLLLVAGRYYA